MFGKLPVCELLHSELPKRKSWHTCAHMLSSMRMYFQCFLSMMECRLERKWLNSQSSGMIEFIYSSEKNNSHDFSSWTLWLTDWSLLTRTCWQGDLCKEYWLLLTVTEVGAPTLTFQAATLKLELSKPFNFKVAFSTQRLFHFHTNPSNNCNSSPSLFSSNSPHPIVFAFYRAEGISSCKHKQKR